MDELVGSGAGITESATLGRLPVGDHNQLLHPYFLPHLIKCLTQDYPGLDGRRAKRNAKTDLWSPWGQS